ncbi:MAG: molybdenum cofactor guanylyltransferase MobA [Methylococcales bacterium]
MNQQTKVTGVILAGGRASRMHNQDKGLLIYQDKPLISYAIAALAGLTEHIVINANRNHDRYAQFGFPVIADANRHFDGPLAGLLAAMNYTDSQILLTMPCDSPLIKAEQLSKLLCAYAEHDADIAVACVDGHMQPVFLAINPNLTTSLQQYLDSGQRKMAFWLLQHKLLKVDFSAEREHFININTPADLAAL